MAASAPLHLISWNVAGWDATTKYIKSHYKSVDAYMDRHNADILALQEVKITKEKLKADPAAAHAHPIGDYESFWAFPVVEGAAKKSAAKRGFNGVTTYAKRGLTVAADPAPLGDPVLDAEGRCLLTDHGNFVLINVYAHATHGDDYEAKLALKLRFFAALSALMSRLRAAGRHVILCGDLNVAARGADAPWKQSLIPIAELRLTDDDTPAAEDAPPAEGVADASAAAAHSSEAPDSAEAGESNAVSRASAAAAAVETLHAALGAGGRRSLALALPPGGPRRVVSGSKLLATVCAVLEGRARAYHAGSEAGGEEGEGGRDDDDEAEAVEEVPAGGACGAAVDAAAGALASLAHWVGISPSQRECVEWLTSLVTDEQMVDTFASVRPAASHRFTCWCAGPRPRLGTKARLRIR